MFVSSTATPSITQGQLIVVLGCTGTVGAEVMRHLATRDCAVRGILRQANRRYPVPYQDQPARVSYVAADHSSLEHLTQVMIGADKLFLLMGTHLGQVESETRAIAAAERAGVQRIVKLSAPVVTAPASVEVANWHRAIEDRLAASDIEHCSLRPYAFMQNWLRNTYSIQHFGTIVGSAGTAPRNYVDCRDVAAIATELLLCAQPPTSEALTVTGPEVLTNQELADRMSLVTGATVKYHNLSRNEHYEMLRTQAELPEWLAQHVVELEELAARVPEQATNTVQQLLGRQARTMDEFLQEHRAAFVRAA